jgi:hypothetical protein
MAPSPARGYACNMHRALRDEILRVGGDVADPRWVWFARQGPHGPAFTWSAVRGEPRGHVGLEHLAKVIDEHEQADPGFREWSKLACRVVLDRSAVGNLLRRALQISAVVGEETDLPRLRAFQVHEDPDVAADARAAVFHLKRRT